MAKDGAKKGKGKKVKVYGPATVLKPLCIGGFVLMLLNILLPALLGG